MGRNADEVVDPARKKRVIPALDVEHRHLHGGVAVPYAPLFPEIVTRPVPDPVEVVRRDRWTGWLQRWQILVRPEVEPARYVGGGRGQLCGGRVGMAGHGPHTR